MGKKNAVATNSAAFVVIDAFEVVTDPVSHTINDDN